MEKWIVRIMPDEQNKKVWGNVKVIPDLVILKEV